MEAAGARDCANHLTRGGVKCAGFGDVKRISIASFAIISISRKKNWETTPPRDARWVIWRE